MVEIEDAVPTGWVSKGDFGSTQLDRHEFFRSPEGQLGLWFELSPRSEGDFASPHPTRYGGFLLVPQGPLVAWESTQAFGFIRYPPFTRSPNPPTFLTEEPVELLIYVPVVNSAIPAVANGTFELLWDVAEGGDRPVAVVMRVSPVGGDQFYVHDGQAGVGRLGYSHVFDNNALHIYQLQSCGCRA